VSKTTTLCDYSVTSSFGHLRNIPASLVLVLRTARELLSILCCDCAVLFIFLVDDHNPTGNCAEKSMAARNIKDKSDTVSLYRIRSGQCPAVSQICSLMVFRFSRIAMCLKSMSTVIRCDSMKLSIVNRTRSELLPKADSPKEN
jgi:hypothetical protein